jgi:hypothetical protein
LLVVMGKYFNTSFCTIFLSQMGNRPCVAQWMAQGTAPSEWWGNLTTKGCFWGGNCQGNWGISKGLRGGCDKTIKILAPQGCVLALAALASPGAG